MEIVCKDLSYKNKTLLLLNKLNLSFTPGNIYCVLGNNQKLLGEILSLKKRLSSGVLSLGNTEVKRTSHISNIEEIKKNIVYLPYEREYTFSCKTVEKEILSFLSNVDTEKDRKHIVSSLRLVGLDETYLSRNPKSLSYTEQKLVKLACCLSYNPSVLVLDKFFSGFSHREIEYFQKLFLKLKSKFNKTIILFDNKIDILMKVVDILYVIHNGELVLSGGKELFYEDVLYQYISKPKIVELTNYIIEKGYIINKYIECNEFIKEVFRYIKY